MRVLTCAMMMLVIGGLWSASQAIEFLDVDQPASTTIWGGVDKQSQSFVTGPTTEYITAIEYQTWNPNGTSDAATLTLRDYNTAGTNPDPAWETGALLATKAETFVGAVDSGWLRFQFDAPVDVTPNTSYTFFVQVTSGPSGFYRHNAAGDVYPPGLNKRFITPTGYDNDGFDSDLAFRVYADVVPEPATFGLLALGGIALLRSRKR